MTTERSGKILVCLATITAGIYLPDRARAEISPEQYQIVQKHFPNAYSFMNDFFNQSHTVAGQARQDRFTGKASNEIQIKAATLGTNCIDQMETRAAELPGCAALEKLLKPYGYVAEHASHEVKKIEANRKFLAVCIWSRAFGRYEESGDSVKRNDCLFPLTGMEIVQKVNGGYMLSADDGILSYLETPEDLQKGPFPNNSKDGESYAYVTGVHKYVALDGFEKDRLALKLYKGAIPEQVCTPECRPHP
jgi:hypothetical protein